ncbi:type 2 periplasmic-binding domain-containing protein [Cohnella fermenti]|uniref:Extracellular solute-binding protein n=1 Tax=Cohnella fermenti TaxID=2565925 RepID=A0A4S4C387_9BACL|nr:extracellular solute-binding protein [Cohnella fermenti]THF81625.1 extracellular solute-binding protein [Cohnella fermenti]
MRSKRKWMSPAIAMLAMATALAGCNSNNGGSEASNGETSASNGSASEGAGAPELPLLTYNIFSDTQSLPTWVNESDDVMAQYVKEKFNIQVGEVSYLQGMTLKERLNLFIASNELPDVIMTSGANAAIAATGRYAELGDLIKEHAPNFMELVPEEYWKDQLIDGKLYSFGTPMLDGADYPDDPFAQPNQTWKVFFTSESLLKQLGYKFTPNAEINKLINETGQKPTADMYKIEPEIKTPEDFYQFLKKIKETMPQVNGQDVIPFSIPIWLEPHFGATFGLTGSWKLNPDTGKVSSFLTDDMSKEYWQYMNKLYTEGLLDKDFAIQKTDQLNDKILQGRVKAFMWSSSYSTNADVQQAIKAADPNDSLRAIPLPLEPGATLVGIDHVGKTGWSFYVNKDFEDIPRLIEYWDWTLSQEAKDLAEWGPESLGLWEIKDGKKVWKDEQLLAALRNDDTEYLKENYYGKGLGGGNESIASKTYSGRVIPGTGGYNPYSWPHSYPFEVSPDNYTIQNGILSVGGFDNKGYISSGVSEATNKVVDFIYGEFEQQFSAKLFAAKNEEQFDKGWDETLKYFNDKIGYPSALQEMEAVFQSRGFNVSSNE